MRSFLVSIGVSWTVVRLMLWVAGLLLLIRLLFVRLRSFGTERQIFLVLARDLVGGRLELFTIDGLLIEAGADILIWQILGKVRIGALDTLPTVRLVVIRGCRGRALLEKPLTRYKD